VFISSEEELNLLIPRLHLFLPRCLQPAEANAARVTALSLIICTVERWAVGSGVVGMCVVCCDVVITAPYNLSTAL